MVGVFPPLRGKQGTVLVSALARGHRGRPATARRGRRRRHRWYLLSRLPYEQRYLLAPTLSFGRQRGDRSDVQRRVPRRARQR
jgi:hypothetical protein